MLLIVLFVYIVFFYMKFGCFFYVIGGNIEVVRFLGVLVNCYCMYVYMFLGLFVGIGGVVLVVCIGVGEVNVGLLFLMDVVVVIYIGFFVFGVGKLNVFGMLIGFILIGVLLNGLMMLNVLYYM